mmetsp:Transcript_2112/g.4907  ORF Transcript_2112/g.4907 Transcript_2112/m.4907 type:complete len:142 (-) Transcript_2112:1087-1512(-)|eukprot:g9880.t1
MLDSRILELKREYTLERQKRKHCEEEIRFIQSQLKSDLNEDNLTRFDHTRSFSSSAAAAVVPKKTVSKSSGGGGTTGQSGILAEFSDWQRRLARARAADEQKNVQPEHDDYNEEAARRTFMKAKEDFTGNRETNRDAFRFC